MNMMTKMKLVVVGNGIGASARSRGPARSAGDVPARVDEDAVPASLTALTRAG
jgi:hypothetical protein